jgi:hypothetical protein
MGGETDKELEFERTLEILEQLRESVLSGYREMQETGDDGPLKRAQMRFKVRVKAISAAQPEAFRQWRQANSRFVLAVEQGRNPILC